MVEEPNSPPDGAAGLLSPEKSPPPCCGCEFAAEAPNMAVLCGAVVVTVDAPRTPAGVGALLSMAVPLFKLGQYT